ncbi:STM3941 family protein [Microbacterium sp.]|uniref:STM3941 family protein n=1 Tax=Microbacterium sp. TaxID=51671 RepID=UPI001AD40760|nr:STM3941 family protein [Microbacterium sp.]MBN9188056.1 hypothetical protein [Microbacterium sp.]MBN9191109.1 hypothetical protein [Microbacterium sp.]
MPDPAPELRIVSPRRNLIILAVVCLVFTVMGAVVVVLAPTATLNLIVGVGAVGFFGVGGGVAFSTQWRRSVLLRADDTGIRVTGAGPIPWGDVDRIGSTSTQLGIRLRRYDGYLTGVTGESAASMRAARKQNGGWDLAWPARLLDRSPADAARELERRRPSV